MLLSAVERWDCDFFISDSEGLHTPAGKYRDVPVLRQEQAVAVLSLLLRGRGAALLPGEYGADSLTRMGLWWFYRVGTFGCLQEVRTWQLSLGLDRTPQLRGVDEGDAVGLAMYDEIPIDGVVGRFSHALRARDRIL